MSTLPDQNVSPDQPVPAVAVTELKTPKGQDVWYVQSDVVPLIALSFIFEGGSSQDVAGNSGATMMMTSLLDEGAGPYSSEEYQDKLASRAIQLSFNASNDAISGSLRCLERNVDEAFELLRLALAEPRFDATAIERIRSQIMSILKHQQTDPGSIASKLFTEKAFPGHPYALPTSGFLETIPKIERSELVSVYKRHIGFGRVKIAAAGCLPAERLVALIDKVFGDLPEATPLTSVPKVSIAHLGEQFVSELDIPQSVIRFGLDGVARLDKDFIPAYVFNHILGGGTFTSRLFNEVREKRGLAYNIGTGLHNYRSAAITSGYTATKNESVRECLDVIAEQIEKLKNEGPGTEELQKAKDYLTGSYLLAFDTSSKIAGQLSWLAFEGLGTDYLSKRNQMIRDVSVDDIKRVGARILGEGKFLSVIVGKPEGITK